MGSRFFRWRYPGILFRHTACVVPGWQVVQPHSEKSQHAGSECKRQLGLDA